MCHLHLKRITSGPTSADLFLFLAAEVVHGGCDYNDGLFENWRGLISAALALINALSFTR